MSVRTLYWIFAAMGIVSCGSVLAGSSSTVLATQDFEVTPATPTWTYTGAAPTFNSGTSSASAAPPNSPIGIGASRAWEVTQVSGGFPLEFAPITIPPGYDRIIARFRLAAMNLIGSTGGPDDLDYVLVAYTLDNGGTYTDRVRVRGAINNNSFWAYDATGLASVYFEPATETLFQPTDTGLATTEGYSTVEIEFPPTVGSVGLRITPRSSSSSDTWLVDNLELLGINDGWTVGGTVSGLLGSGLSLSLNGGAPLSIAADGPYQFPDVLLDGSPYNVTVATQPTSPQQTCLVSNASGTITADVTNVDVTCTTDTFTIGGSVSGLAGSGLVLRNNGGDDLPISANGSFTFTTPIASGQPYLVTVATQPGAPAQTCTVANGSGTVNAAVTNVAITCATDAFTIGGSVNGLLGTGLVLRNNGGDDLPISADGAFTFAAPVASGQPYAVTVATMPTSPPQTCVVSNGTGTVAASNVTNVQVDCTVVTHVVSVAITGAGTVNPSGPQTVIDGDTLNLELTADAGYALQSASGCGGTLAGNTYTTGPIVGDCAINVIFAAAAPAGGATALPALDWRTLLLMAIALAGAAVMHQRRARR